MITWKVLTFLAVGLAARPAQALALNHRDNDESISPHSSLSPALTDYVEDIRTKYGVSGIGIATVTRANNSGTAGWESATGGFGTANVQGEPVTKDSLFSIASNTKLITALSVGMLIENGTKLPDGTALAWNTKMKCIFPDLAFPDETQTQLLDVLDLASMRSGMPRHDIALGMEGYETIIKAMPQVKASAELRQTWQYSNWHYILLAGIIPTLTGVPFQDFVQEHIFNPLNMTSTYLNATAAGDTGRWTDGSMRIGMNLTACGEQLQGGKLDEACLGSTERFGKWTDTDSLAMAGAGGTIMSPEDMTKWIQELLDPTVIPQSLIEMAAHGYSILDPIAEFPEYSAQTYSMGQVAFSYRGHQVVTHTGGLPGQNSLLLRLVLDGYGVMIATNEETISTPLLTTIVSRFIDDHLGLEPIDWETRLFGQLAQGGATGEPTTNDSIARPSQDQVVGKYEHPVYGVLDLHSLAGNGSDASSPLSGVGLDVNNTYVAPVDKLFTNYIAFNHHSENVFNWTAAFVKDALGDDRSVNASVVGIVQSGTGSAVINDEGIGMFGDFWGGGVDVPIVQAEIGMANVKERAEVWFDKTW